MEVIRENTTYKKHFNGIGHFKHKLNLIKENPLPHEIQ